MMWKRKGRVMNLIRFGLASNSQCLEDYISQTDRKKLQAGGRNIAKRHAEARTSEGTDGH